ncbi:hypothetical protein QYF61_027983 [Mycteria americana]|uniref:Uncharacterized protein n=1 Tax=Mycteria americana TaxID=33587 RepID=A0AAN7NK25_MYCAM|nr:hypothetical protein QYF61_027983 [Mycteria americana]
MWAEEESLSGMAVTGPLGKKDTYKKDIKPWECVQRRVRKMDERLRSLGLFSLEKRRLRVTSSQSTSSSRGAAEGEVLICSLW